MDRRISSLGDLSALDVAGRVIKYSKDRGRTWTFARLSGDSAIDTLAAGMGLIVAHERNNPVRKVVLTEQDFQDGLIVMSAVTDEALGREWWSD